MFTQRKGGPFKAGQAPTCWQKQIGRAASRVHTLATVCAWLEKLAVTRPRLRTEPLLGRCLEAVTIQEPPPVGEEAPPPVRKADRAPTAIAASKALTAPSADSDQAARRLHKLAVADNKAPHHPAVAEPKRAARALLHRLAGQSAVQPKSPKKVVSPPTAPPILRPPAPAAEPMQAQADLGEQLSQRAAQRLRGRDDEGPSARITPSGRDGISDSTGIRGARLTQQWAQPLNGQRATGPQLHYWSQRQRQDHAGQPAAHRTSAANSAPAPETTNKRTPMPQSAQKHPAPRHAPTPAGEAPRYGHGDGAENGMKTVNKRGAIAPASAGSADARTLPFEEYSGDPNGSNAPTADTNDAADNAPLVAPPQIAQKLPKLTAPHAPNHAPMPIAAATARQSALSNLLSDDDLSGLAANIKRILDAEARRYGIDV